MSADKATFRVMVRQPPSSQWIDLQKDTLGGVLDTGLPQGYPKA